MSVWEDIHRDEKENRPPPKDEDVWATIDREPRPDELPRPRPPRGKAAGAVLAGFIGTGALIGFIVGHYHPTGHTIRYRGTDMDVAIFLGALLGAGGGLVLGALGAFFAAMSE